MMRKLFSFSIITLGLFLYANVACAKSVLLDKTQLTIKGKPAVAELWGEAADYNYAEKLSILVKQDDHVIIAYEPALKGGYSCYLDTLRLKKSAPEEEQLLYCIGKGDWQEPSYYGILDLQDPKHIKELFTAEDNKGLLRSAELKDKKLELTILDKKPSVAAVPNDFIDIQPARNLNFAGYHSVLSYDVDKDGVQELFVCQRVQKNRKQLADVGAVVKLFDGVWKPSGFTIMTAASSKQQDGINNGLSFKEGVIIPRHIVLPRGEYTLPILLLKNNPELHCAINSLIFAHCLPHMQGFIDYTEDFCFKVCRADQKLLSLQFIYGKKSLSYSCLTIDMQTGKKLELKDILDVKNKDLLPLLKLLRSNKEFEFTNSLPATWYIKNNDIYFLENINGKSVGVVYDLNIIRKYVLRKDLLKTD